MHDRAAELPGTQETGDGAGEWVRKLRDALDGVELDLQGLDLDEIEPGLPSDQVRKALDDEYLGLVATSGEEAICAAYRGLADQGPGSS